MFKKDIALLLCLAVSFPFSIFADETNPEEPAVSTDIPERTERVPSPKAGLQQVYEPDSIPAHSLTEALTGAAVADSTVTDSIAVHAAKAALESDSIADRLPDEFARYRNFNPDPTRAVWLSALCPGLGQIYNRKYWKLPIVIGGYVGLAYATSWNNRMLTDYTQAYRDITDSDPNTKSYMDFYPPTTKESDINKDWLTRSLKSKKNFYRRNRDLCIIGMVGLYLICMVDAYVDASLSHFDISPDLSMDIAPAVIDQRDSFNKSLGVQCAFTF